MFIISKCIFRYLITIIAKARMRRLDTRVSNSSLGSARLEARTFGCTPTRWTWNRRRLPRRRISSRTIIYQNEVFTICRVAALCMLLSSFLISWNIWIVCRGHHHHHQCAWFFALASQPAVGCCQGHSIVCLDQSCRNDYLLFGM